MCVCVCVCGGGGSGHGVIAVRTSACDEFNYLVQISHADRTFVRFYLFTSFCFVIYVALNGLDRPFHTHTMGGEKDRFLF